MSLGFHVANTLLLFRRAAADDRGVLAQRDGGGAVRAASAARGIGGLGGGAQGCAERVFFLLTLWAYARYARRSEVQKSRSAESVIRGHWHHGRPRLDHASRFHASLFYLLCPASFFALGLMSKPMLVTLPFVLLLLDYWPLRRLQLQP